jgi:hypothetical protein
VPRGQRRPHRGAALLHNVQTEDSEFVSDHIWITETSELIALNPSGFGQTALYGGRSILSAQLLQSKRPYGNRL